MASQASIWSKFKKRARLQPLSNSDSNLQTVTLGNESNIPTKRALEEPVQDGPSKIRKLTSAASGSAHNIPGSTEKSTALSAHSSNVDWLSTQRSFTSTPSYLQSNCWIQGIPQPKAASLEVLASIFKEKHPAQTDDPLKELTKPTSRKTTVARATARAAVRSAKKDVAAAGAALAPIRPVKSRKKRTTARSSSLSCEIPPLDGGSLFLRVPGEVRDQIYQYLLVADGPIMVLNGWSEVYARCRIKIDTSILYVCKQVSAEAIRVLYSHNHFQYLLRDSIEPGSSPSSSPRQTPDQTSNRPTISLARYGPLLRNLSLLTERNRSGPEHTASAARALVLLAATPGLHLRAFRLTLHPERRTHLYDMADGSTQCLPSYSFLDYLARGSDVRRGLARLPARFVTVGVLTPREGRLLRTTLDMRFGCGNGRDGVAAAAGVEAHGCGDMLAADVVAQQDRTRRAAEAGEQLRQLRERVYAVCDRGEAYINAVVDAGWWEEVTPGCGGGSSTGTGSGASSPCSSLGRPRRPAVASQLASASDQLEHGGEEDQGEPGSSLIMKVNKVNDRWVAHRA